MIPYTEYQKIGLKRVKSSKSYTLELKKVALNDFKLQLKIVTEKSPSQ